MKRLTKKLPIEAVFYNGARKVNCVYYSLCLAIVVVLEWVDFDCHDCSQEGPMVECMSQALLCDEQLSQNYRASKLSLLTDDEKQRGIIFVESQGRSVDRCAHYPCVSAETCYNLHVIREIKKGNGRGKWKRRRWGDDAKE
jgi:hypothetical protein